MNIGDKIALVRKVKIMNIGDKIALVCCSNGQSPEQKSIIENLEKALLDIGLAPIFSKYIYQTDSVYSGTAKQRADELMRLYRSEDIKAIFDISGGDIANELLLYLDFDVIANSTKQFWGYSDLTTILNAIYAKTGKTSVLYQIKNIVRSDDKIQIQEFSNALLNADCELFDFPYEFVRGTKMDGIAVGGNIRCLLKLAGTHFFPDMQDKLLVLEAMSGLTPKIVTCFSQLACMGVFDQVKGVLLGTFTQMEAQEGIDAVIEIAKRFIPENVPIAKTQFIGHAANSKAIILGQQLSLGGNI